MTAVINGAWTGRYCVRIHHDDGVDPQGWLDSADLIWTSVAEVTAITPNTGSAAGGTLLTLTGGHFGDASPDQDVNLIFVGDSYCQVVARTDTEIKCRVEPRAALTTGAEAVAVFMKLAEEAPIVTGLNAFSFVDPASKVTDIDMEYNTATNQ